MKARRRLVFAAKLALASLLVAWVLRQVAWQEMAAALVGVRPWLLGAAVAVHLLFIALLSIRWWLLLRAAGVAMPLGEATKLNFLGLFFNAFLPGSVGGDVVKAWYASRRAGDDGMAPVLVSVVVDRLFGLLGFALVVVVAITATLLAGGLDEATRVRAVASAAAVVGGVLALLAVALAPGLRRWLRLGWLLGRIGLGRQAEGLGRAMDTFSRRPSALAAPMAVGLGATLAMVGSFALLGEAVGLTTPWRAYYLYVPIITILSAVPLTPGAVGVAERLYLLYFTDGSCSPSQVLAFVLLTRILSMACTLPGGLVLLGGGRPLPAEINGIRSAETS